MNFPKYVKCKTLPDKNGEIHTEWVVRLMDKSMDNQDGKKIPTPVGLLDRYYSVRCPHSKGDSILKSRKDKSHLYITYKELSIFKCSSNIEVD